MDIRSLSYIEKNILQYVIHRIHHVFVGISFEVLVLERKKGGFFLTVF